MKNTTTSNSASACITWIEQPQSAACITWIEQPKGAACITWIEQGDCVAQRPTVSLSLKNLEEALV